MDAFIDETSPAQRITAITAMMLRGEAEEGRKPVWPIDIPSWLNPSDWIGWPVISMIDDEVHIVALWSARSGAFHDLIADIRHAGLYPVVVSPFAQMESILRRWKWKKRIVGEGWTQREEWRPRANG